MKRHEEIILKYYPEGTLRNMYYTAHASAVTKLAIEIVQRHPELKADENFVELGGMLHDIGIFMTKAPQIGCEGTYPYICHGFLGRELLEKEGLKGIAPVCERHIGTGITIEEIERRKLPLPRRDMLPKTIEEKIITYADKFFSKSSDDLSKPKPLDEIIDKLSKHGKEKVERFREMMDLFGYDYIYK